MDKYKHPSKGYKVYPWNGGYRAVKIIEKRTPKNQVGIWRIVGNSETREGAIILTRKALAAESQTAQGLIRS